MNVVNSMMKLIVIKNNIVVYLKISKSNQTLYEYESNYPEHVNVY